MACILKGLQEQLQQQYASPFFSLLKIGCGKRPKGGRPSLTLNHFAQIDVNDLVLEWAWGVSLALLSFPDFDE